MNYKYRMHYSRIGRFFAVDPLAPKYPHNSPYAFSENRVTNSVELEGLESNDNVESINPNHADNKAKDLVDGGLMDSIPETYYKDYSKEFNSLGVNEQNYLINKLNKMTAQNNTYESMLRSHMVNGTSDYGRWADDGFWSQAAEQNWQRGFSSWSKDGTGTFWANAATYGIGGTILLTTGATALESLTAGGGSPIMTYLTTNNVGQRIGGGIQSGSLNFITQLYGNGFDIGAVDWTGVGSATLTGIATGSGYLNLVVSSGFGAGIDAMFDYSMNTGFTTILAPEGSQYYKPGGNFGRDFIFGFLGNFMGGMSSGSGGLGGLNTPSILMESLIDAAMINLNLQINKRAEYYSE